MLESLIALATSMADRQERNEQEAEPEYTPYLGNLGVGDVVYDGYFSPECG